MKVVDGSAYAAKSFVKEVCQKGAFKIAAVGLDHGHIYGMVEELVSAGAQLVYICDTNSERAAAMAQNYEGVSVVDDYETILADVEIKLVVCAAIANLRSGIGVRAMNAGIDFLSDKPAITTLADLALVEETIKQTGRKFAVCYSERLHNEASVLVGRMIEAGKIGRVLEVIGMGPHREGDTREDWFYEKKAYGGILCDIGSHQFEQFLHFTGNTGATINYARVANYVHGNKPNFEDFGDVMVVGQNGATGFFKVDWFTPRKLSSWGDGRIFIMGTTGTIEIRKYVDVANNEHGENNIYLVNEDGEQYINATGQVGFPFFGELILDCLQGTSVAQDQQIALLAAKLSIEAQEMAVKIEVMI
ncbi:MAG: Gfo/Idh/MocA family protein [Culicoidibacterales bacterium]